MNGLERFRATAAFQAADRIPAIPLVFGHAAVLAGVGLDEYLRDGALLARCQLEAQALYGTDAVYVYMDAFVETEAVGSKLRFGRDSYPEVLEYAFKAGDDPGRLVVPDPEKDGRMPQILEALSLLSAQVGDRLVIVSALEGPMTLVTQIMGMQDALYFAADHPDDFERLLDFATDVVIRYGSAQIRAGTHVPMVFDPSSSPSIVPAQFFREFLLRRLTRIFGAFRQAGAPGWLNIPGHIQPLLRYCPEAGVQIISLDYEVPAAEAREVLPTTVLVGNIKPMDLVLGSPEQVFRDASALCESFTGRGGFMLSSGSEVPLESRPENVRALVSAREEKE